jgi:methylamine dehydrogenase accessory protein MauD
MSSLLISVVALWIAVIVLAVIVVALIRQVGVLYERIAPAGALMLPNSLPIGASIPPLELEDLSGRRLLVGGQAEDGRSTLLFFLSPTCPVCEQLLPIVKSIGDRERSWLRVVLASDGDREAQVRYCDRHDLDGLPYVLSSELGMYLRIGKTPYAVLIDETGSLRSQGLTNTREHLESLFEAKERGVASIQDYLRRRHEQGSAHP